MAKRGRPRHPSLLTPGEQRVLKELRQGGTNAEIAVRLGLSPETVKTHIASMLSKLDLRDRGELAAVQLQEAAGRRRIPGVMGVPLGFSLPTRPLVWTGVGLAGAAGVAAAAIIIAAVTTDSDPPSAPAMVSTPAADATPSPPTTPSTTTTPEPSTTAAGTPAPTPIKPPPVTRTIAIIDQRFDLSEIKLNAGAEATIVLVNLDKGVVHNLVIVPNDYELVGPIYESAPIDGCLRGCARGGTEVRTDLAEGVNVQRFTFTAPPAGSYSFWCEVHPDTMLGVLTVLEGQALSRGDEVVGDGVSRWRLHSVSWSIVIPDGMHIRVGPGMVGGGGAGVPIIDVESGSLLGMSAAGYELGRVLQGDDPERGGGTLLPDRRLGATPRAPNRDHSRRPAA